MLNGYVTFCTKLASCLVEVSQGYIFIRLLFFEVRQDTRNHCLNKAITPCRIASASIGCSLEHLGKLLTLEKPGPPSLSL